MTPILISIDGDEPLTLDEAARNYRADDDDNSPASYFEADEIASAIRDAREDCEKVLEISLVRKTLEVAANSWLCSDGCRYGVHLPQGPVRSIVSVKYLDADGNDTTLAADQYRFDPYSRTPLLIPAYDVTWPTIRGDLNSIRVRYEVGYPSDDSPAQTVPGPVTRAMKLLINHYLDHPNAADDARLAELPLGVGSLLAKYRHEMGV